jgi:hypothetical protein
MEVVATTKLNLEVASQPFEILFSWNKKRGVSNDKDYWFTPSGICKIYIGALHTVPVGDITNEKYKEMCQVLKKNKTEVFTDERGNYFTLTGGSCGEAVAEVRNIESILYQAQREWEARAAFEDWT